MELTILSHNPLVFPRQWLLVLGFSTNLCLEFFIHFLHFVEGLCGFEHVVQQPLSQCSAINRQRLAILKSVELALQLLVS